MDRGKLTLSICCTMWTCSNVALSSIKACKFEDVKATQDWICSKSSKKMPKHHTMHTPNSLRDLLGEEHADWATCGHKPVLILLGQFCVGYSMQLGQHRRHNPVSILLGKFCVGYSITFLFQAGTSLKGYERGMPEYEITVEIHSLGSRCLYRLVAREEVGNGLQPPIPSQNEQGGDRTEPIPVQEWGPGGHSCPCLSDESFWHSAIVS